MSITARKTLVALLIALHAAIAACGPGLHAVSGLGHLRPTGRLARSDGPTELTRLATTGPEHCSICDYCSQGQLPSPTPPPISEPLAVRHVPADPPRDAPRPPDPSTRSRAPPPGLARTV